MPRDIRSYFTVTSQKKNSEPVVPKPKKRRVISSDEDEEKPNSSVKRSKIVQKIKKVSALSDSEDDEEIVRKDQKHSKQSKANKEKENGKQCQEISSSDIFGKKPITRVEETKVSWKLQKAESEFHDDDDFDAVLKQLDGMEAANAVKDENNMKGTDVSKDFKMLSQTEVKPSNNEDHNTSLKDSQNKRNEAVKEETKETKKSSKKSSNESNKAHSNIVTRSPLKRKLEEEEKGSSSSNDNLDRNIKYNNASKRSKSKNLEITSKVSTSKEARDAKRRSPDRKKAKTVDLFEERVEKKKQRSAMYEKYLQRGGARNPGSKEIPKGAINCLAGVTFLITGVFDSLERNEADELIQKYGGRTVNAVSGKVNYIIVGDEAGPAKLAKASSLGIEQISEDDLLEMIRTRPEGQARDIKPAAMRGKPHAKKMSNKSESDKSSSPYKTETSSPEKVETPSSSSGKTKTLSPSTQSSSTSSNSQEKTTSVGSQPLVEKYRPRTMKQIIGQQGDKSSANNLYVWLRDWHKNRQDPKFKDGTGKQTHGQSFKAALLSGPPGVGKTTTAQVVCRELGYDLVEFNASDTRNKTLLKEEVSGLLSNTTIKGYVTGAKQKITNKHVLLMDEVDGMAGNEDRGGLQELVSLMKNTEVPIICICNDRFNTKVKTIATHSYDLRFSKLRVEQIRSSMKSLCYKESIKISTEDLDRLIESTNHDIRQVINHLEFLGSPSQTTHVEKTDRKHANKNFKLGPFDVVKMAFNAQEQKNMSLNDKIGLYFHDYNIAPLFVQENYLGVRLSQVSTTERLQRIANAADSISQGDLVEKVMRSNMMWSLLPLHACFSFVIPSSEMSGGLDALVRFPSWFGRNSKATRFNRLMQELTTHTRLATGSSKDALNMDYMVHIRNAVTRPLINNGTDGIEEAINVMGKYHLTRQRNLLLLALAKQPVHRREMANELNVEEDAAK
ncbi:hypothetical protein DMN91_003242 [Ooceraea biroi]|uniref:Replication factor C subunit 1 n=1 Tax=Ooceraea biroi TaxID=2015173 RepID=A0A3L8DXE9_OOCBI|nr:hypothetical protein DMN91_003242 [Ooceraea biroi]